MKTVQEIADIVGGRVHGDAALEIRTVGSLERATRGALAYAEGKHLAEVAATAASCVLIPEVEIPDRTVIVVAKPRVAFARAAQSLLPPRLPPPGVHETALVAPEATLGANVSIGAWTIVEAGATVGAGTVIFPGGYVGAGSSIGADCILYPRVVLYPGTAVGNRVILHAGVVIGSDGFGFVFDGERQVKVPQVGRAQLGDDVEIGANACIDRGALDETTIADGVKVDNLCHLGHNVRVGDHAVISAQTGIAGSSTVGREAIIGGQVGIAGLLPHRRPRHRRRAVRHPVTQARPGRPALLGHSRTAAQGHQEAAGLPAPPAPDGDRDREPSQGARRPQGEAGRVTLRSRTRRTAAATSSTATASRQGGRPSADGGEGHSSEEPLAARRASESGRDRDVRSPRGDTRRGAGRRGRSVDGDGWNPAPPLRGAPDRCRCRRRARSARAAPPAPAASRREPGPRRAPRPSREAPGRARGRARRQAGRRRQAAPPARGTAPPTTHGGSWRRRGLTNSGRESARQPMAANNLAAQARSAAISDNRVTGGGTPASSTRARSRYSSARCAPARGATGSVSSRRR